MRRFEGSGWIRRTLVAVLSLALLAPTLAMPVAYAQQSATLQGVILDPTGRPTPGFKVVFKDVVSGTEYTSSASNAAGEYSLQVPVGSRFLLTTALAPDGTRLPIQAGSPLPVRAAGVYRRDVQFQLQGAQATEPTPAAPPAEPPKAAAEPSKPTPATPPAPATQAPAPGAKKPWWKTTGGVIGIVLGAGALAALAAGGGSSGSSSPSNP